MSARQGRRTIELVGPAGAGKTTIVRALVRDEPGVIVGPEISFRSLRQWPVIIPSAARLRPVLNGVRREIGWEEFKSMVYLEGWIGLLNGVERTLVLDHGPLFKLAKLKAHGPRYFRNEPNWWKESFRRWLAYLDVIVWLDAPDEILMVRINGRQQEHAAKGQRSPVVFDFLDRYRRCYLEMLDAALDSGISVLRFDTSTMTPEQIGREILNS